MVILIIRQKYEDSMKISADIQEEEPYSKNLLID